MMRRLRMMMLEREMEKGERERKKRRRLRLIFEIRERLMMLERYGEDYQNTDEQEMGD